MREFEVLLPESVESLIVTFPLLRWEQYTPLNKRSVIHNVQDSQNVFHVLPQTCNFGFKLLNFPCVIHQSLIVFINLMLEIFEIYFFVRHKKFSFAESTRENSRFFREVTAQVWGD